MKNMGVGAFLLTSRNLRSRQVCADTRSVGLTAAAQLRRAAIQQYERYYKRVLEQSPAARA
jgi:hypothetical protein